MKKTFTINISGTVFHIDDDAYERLNNYIFQINRHFGNDADAKEIVEDIESRISELFQERVKDGNEVITLEQVDEIIVIMGMPEAFAEPNEAEPFNADFWATKKAIERGPDRACIKVALIQSGQDIFRRLLRLPQSACAEQRP